MSTFTLLASSFPGIGKQFIVGVPLQESPQLTASQFMARLETNTMLFLDSNNDPAIVSTGDFPGADFTIAAGQAFIIINGKNKVTGPNVVFTGTAWCNTFSPTPAPGHTTPCP